MSGTIFVMRGAQCMIVTPFTKREMDVARIMDTDYPFKGIDRDELRSVHFIDRRLSRVEAGRLTPAELKATEV